jgi:hypothetical protein
MIVFPDMDTPPTTHAGQLIDAVTAYQTDLADAILARHPGEGPGNNIVMGAIMVADSAIRLLAVLGIRPWIRDPEPAPDKLLADVYRLIDERPRP